MVPETPETAVRVAAGARVAAGVAIEPETPETVVVGAVVAVSVAVAAFLGLVDFGFKALFQLLVGGS